MVTNASLAIRLSALAVAGALVSSAAFAQGGITGTKQGKGGSVVQGAAGTAGSSGDSGLEHCDKPMGAVAVVEPQDEILELPAPLQPAVAGRPHSPDDSAVQLLHRRRARPGHAETPCRNGPWPIRASCVQDSNVGGGQMVTADFILTPSVVFSENNAGGVGGGVGGLLGRRAGIIGGIAGGLKFKEAQTSMLLADARSTVQVAAAEGSTKKADLRLGAGLFGGGVGAAGGGYGNTNEGKIIAAAFMDNYNGIVGVVRGDPSLQRNVGTLAQEAAAGGKKKAGAVFNEGDVLSPEDRQHQADGRRQRHREVARHAGSHRRTGGDWRGEGRLHQRAGRQRRRLGEDRPGQQTLGRSRARGCGRFRRPLEHRRCFSDQPVAPGHAIEGASGLSRSDVLRIPERGARLARREERACRPHVSDEQRRQAGCPARKPRYI